MSGTPRGRVLADRAARVGPAGCWSSRAWSGSSPSSRSRSLRSCLRGGCAGRPRGGRCPLGRARHARGAHRRGDAAHRATRWSAGSPARARLAVRRPGDRRTGSADRERDGASRAVLARVRNVRRQCPRAPGRVAHPLRPQPASGRSSARGADAHRARPERPCGTAVRRSGAGRSARWWRASLRTERSRSRSSPAETTPSRASARGSSDIGCSPRRAGSERSVSMPRAAASTPEETTGSSSSGRSTPRLPRRTFVAPAAPPSWPWRP